MKSLIRFINENKRIGFVVACVYYILVVSLHLEFGKLIAHTLDIPLGRKTYNHIILILATLLLIGFLFWFFKGLRRQDKTCNKITLIYLMVTLGLIVAAINVIMVVNVELIHVLQYAILAILLFPLIGRYYDVLFWTTFMGAIDELYQYMYLAPTATDYFDINDVIINMLGAVMGLLLLRSQGIFEIESPVKWYKSSWFKGVFVLSIIILGLWLFGQLSFYPTENDVVFEFIREFTPGFWREIPPKVLFHVIQPLEGLIILIILFGFYNKIRLRSETNNLLKK